MEIVSNGHYTVIPNGCREISMDIEVLDGSVSIQNEKGDYYNLLSAASPCVN